MDSPDRDLTCPTPSVTADAPTAPAWAYFIPDSVFVPGYDLHSGDTLYLSNRAYPRVLWTQLSRESWSVLVQMPDRHFRSTISIEPQHYYVVKRATKR